MKILTSLKVNETLQKQLQEKFPNETFSFHSKMNTAKAELPKADILLTYGEDLTPELIEKADNLRWIMVMSAGMDQMPFEAISKKDILVTNARGIHKIPMAEYTISSMLQVARKTKKLIEHENEGKWDRKVNMVELHGKTVLILGVGAIGSEIARLSKVFNMKTLGISRSGKPVQYVDEVYQLKDLQQVIKEADFIVSVLPSTNETRYILEEEHFNEMKQESVFINIGRGDVVSEKVLLNALVNEKISHVVLDVFETEPLPDDHVFWEMENVTVTPHLSGITKNYLPRAIEIFEKNFETFIREEKDFVNKVEIERGY